MGFITQWSENTCTIYKTERQIEKFLSNPILNILMYIFIFYEHIWTVFFLSKTMFLQFCVLFLSKQNMNFSYINIYSSPVF